MPKVNTNKVFKEKIKTQYLVHKLVILWEKKSSARPNHPLLKQSNHGLGFCKTTLQRAKLAMVIGINQSGSKGDGRVRNETKKMWGSTES